MWDGGCGMWDGGCGKADVGWRMVDVGDSIKLRILKKSSMQSIPQSLNHKAPVYQQNRKS